jgi:hypothetical protein
MALKLHPYRVNQQVRKLNKIQSKRTAPTSPNNGLLNEQRTLVHEPYTPLGRMPETAVQGCQKSYCIVCVTVLSLTEQNMYRISTASQRRHMMHLTSVFHRVGHHGSIAGQLPLGILSKLTGLRRSSHPKRSRCDKYRTLAQSYEEALALQDIDAMQKALEGLISRLETAAGSNSEPRAGEIYHRACSFYTMVFGEPLELNEWTDLSIETV